MSKVFPVKLSEDMQLLIDNWIYLDKELINNEMFYYNVPINGADIQDDIGHIQGISVGDLIKIQPLFSEILGFTYDNNFIFYNLTPLYNQQHQGLVYATDLSSNVYVFVVDKIQQVYSVLYQKLGCDLFDKEDKNTGFLGDYLIPSCANVIDLVEALKNHCYLPDYIVKKYATNNIHRVSKTAMMIPKGKNKYIIDLPQHMDFKKLFKKMKVFNEFSTLQGN